ncbi:hypothetical protein PORY_001081 [Pneumocystis oryctolagi]|uniref:Uncharacterized protein n=1 Tax=Pneumocystis oryctolagi TaxID=42067 RepID=A0ACB7CDF5_9ASCO|nr:hypothetical protein PORY_001081 [Pneumocystis oryctolagi]
MGKNIEPLDGEVYEVERICEEFVQEDGNILYRISWKGYSKEFDTWEPIENLIDCKHALEDWNRSKKSALKKRQRDVTLNKYTKKKNVSKNDLYENDKNNETPLKKPFFLKNILKSDKIKDMFKESQIDHIKKDNNKKDSDVKENEVCDFKLNKPSFNILNSFESNMSETSFMGNQLVDSNKGFSSVSGNKVSAIKYKDKKKLFCSSLTESPITSKSVVLNDSLATSGFEYIKNVSDTQNLVMTKFTDLDKSFSHVKLNRLETDLHKRDCKIPKYVNKELNVMSLFSLRNDRDMFLKKLDMLLGPPVFLINDVDSDMSPVDFEFITSYKYGLGVEPRNPMFISGCNCPKDGCDLNNPSSCQCLEDSSNKDFSYDKDGRIRCYTSSIIYECNENCDCGIKCPNRVVQRGRKIPLDIFKTRRKGWGLRCPRFIKAGTFIGVYLGELICQTEAEARGKKYDNAGVTYLFDLDLFEDQVDDYYTIDAQYCGDVTRFINHSCDPNLAIYTVLRDKSDPKIYDIALFAIKDIPPLEELCFDYSGRNNEDDLGFIGNCSNSRVSFKGNCCTIRYIGPLKGIKGKWLGVEWDDPSYGKHNGTYLGETYFECKKENSGSFIRQSRTKDINKSFVDAFNDKYKHMDVKEHNNIESLKFGNTNTDIKICEIYYPKSVNKNRRFCIVTLDSMSISKLGDIEKIKEECADISEIDLSKNPLNWETVIMIIKELPNLNILRLNYNQFNITEIMSNDSFKFPNIKTFTLNKTYLKITEIKKVSSFFENLEELQISYNSLTLETSEELLFSDRLPHLKRIFLNNNKISCFKTLTKIFGKLTKLEFLSLASNQINSIDIIPNTFISLKYLDISQNNIYEWSSIDNLNALSSLISLKFMDNPLLKEFKDNPSLFIIPRLKNIMITQEERQNAELYYLYTIENDVKSGKIINYSCLTAMHPQWKELQKKYKKENPIFKYKKNSKENIETKLIELCVIFEEKIIRKKFILSMNIRSFRSFCAKLFKIDLFRFTISYLEKPNRRIYINDDSKQLSFYNLSPGEFIYIRQTTEENKVLLGHPGNNLKTGIIGLANVGKSTLFQVPYATIDPEEARVSVPDENFDWLCNLYKPISKIPAFLTIFDIAGLTKGASTGAGLGNAFLSHIRAVDALFQLVRAFDDAEIIHVEGDVDPCRDLQIVQDELLVKDIEFVNKQLEALKRVTSRGSQTLEFKANKEKQAIVEKVLHHLAVEKKEIRKGEWSNKEVQIINSLFLLTAKPIIYLVNLSEKDYLRQKNKWLSKIVSWVEDNSPGDIIIPISVAFEERLSRMTDQEAQEECKRLGTKSMLPKIVTVGYSSLNLIHYFTCGPDEVRAWTIRKGTKAPSAAGIIHTDFEKNFVVGEIMKFEDLKKLGSEASVKSAGKYMTKGKDYIVEHNDIIYWKAGKK